MTDTLEDTGVVAEVNAWLEKNWDPDLTSASGGSAWAPPAGPRRRCPRAPTARACRATTRVLVQQAHRRARRARARPAGSACCSPRRRSPPTARPSRSSEYVRPIVTGQRAWCQLFSEPGAGSDLAGPAGQGRSGRRRVDRQRPEGVDLRRPGRRHGHAHRPHQPERAQAPGHHVLRDRHAPAAASTSARCGR